MSSQAEDAFGSESNNVMSRIDNFTSASQRKAEGLFEVDSRVRGAKTTEGEETAAEGEAGVGSGSGGALAIAAIRNVVNSRIKTTLKNAAVAKFKNLLDKRTQARSQDGTQDNSGSNDVNNNDGANVGDEGGTPAPANGAPPAADADAPAAGADAPAAGADGGAGAAADADVGADALTETTPLGLGGGTSYGSVDVSAGNLTEGTPLGFGRGTSYGSNAPDPAVSVDDNARVGNSALRDAQQPRSGIETPDANPADAPGDAPVTDPVPDPTPPTTTDAPDLPGADTPPDLPGAADPAASATDPAAAAGTQGGSSAEELAAQLGQQGKGALKTMLQGQGLDTDAIEQLAKGAGSGSLEDLLGTGAELFGSEAATSLAGTVGSMALDALGPLGALGGVVTGIWSAIESDDVEQTASKNASDYQKDLTFLDQTPQLQTGSIAMPSMDSSLFRTGGIGNF